MRRFVRAALVAALVLGVSGGVAWATGLADSLVGSDGTINACVQKNQGQTRIVPPRTSCRPDEQSLSFNQKGPKGDEGDKGDTGEGLTAAPLPAGDTQCAGIGGLAVSTQSGTPLGVLCNGAPGAPGAKGDKGEKGDTGDTGPAGPALAGSPCTLPSGTAGTVQMNVAASGAISFVCQTAGGGGGGGVTCPSSLPTYPNSTTTCDATTGALGITCDAGYANRDGNIANGCEWPISTEVCNGLDDDGDGQIDNNLVLPALPNATAGCISANVVITSCNAGFVDADRLVADGCETNILTDPANCGAAGRPIPANGTLHANWACVNGTAVITSCVLGWVDANGSPIDGCELAAGSTGLPIGWAKLQFPPGITIGVGTPSPLVYGDVFIAGATDASLLPVPGLQAEVGFGPADSSPDGNLSWVWTSAGFPANVGNNDEYAAAFISFVAGAYDYVYRFTTDGGTTWVYGELDGPHTAASYDSTQAGHLTVLP